MKNQKPSMIRKINNFNLDYFAGATLIGAKELPLLRKTESVPTSVISFSEINRVESKKDYYVDFFIDDYRFESIWRLIYLPNTKNNNLIESFPNFHWLFNFDRMCQFDKLYREGMRLFKKLKRFAGIISPDFSMYPELPKIMREYNCFRSRAMAYYLEQNNFNVIPSVAWATEEDFEYCFDGIAKYSTVAISSNGCKNNEYSKNVFLCGVEELQRKIEPSTLIVCGSMQELEKYTNIKVYPSFSERRKQRQKELQMKRDRQLLLPN